MPDTQGAAVTWRRGPMLHFYYRYFVFTDTKLWVTLSYTGLRGCVHGMPTTRIMSINVARCRFFFSRPINKNQMQVCRIAHAQKWCNNMKQWNNMKQGDQWSVMKHVIIPVFPLTEDGFYVDLSESHPAPLQRVQDAAGVMGCCGMPWASTHQCHHCAISSIVVTCCHVDVSVDLSWVWYMAFIWVFTRFWPWPPRSQDLELKEKIEALAAEAGSCRILVSPSPMKGIAGIAIISASGARARNVQGLVPSLNSMEKDYRQRLILCLVVLPFWVSIGMVVLTDTNGMLLRTNSFR